MGKLHSAIDEDLTAFFQAQHMFFVATAPNDAPSGEGGHINLSPKGLDTLRILGPQTVAYLDFVGSGVETIAHTRQNGRIVLMFCVFEGPPRIVRLHGRGRAIEPADPEFAALLPKFTASPGVRAIIQVEVERVSDSCGYGVPLYRFEGHRTQLTSWAEKKGEAGLAEYQRQKNAESIDHLPGLRWLKATTRT